MFKIFRTRQELYDSIAFIVVACLIIAGAAYFNGPELPPTVPVSSQTHSTITVVPDQ